MIGDIVSAIGNWFGGQAARESSENIAEKNIAMQREFAQNGIQWKVNDAKAAGVHPLFALGASTTSFSNVAGGDGGADYISKMGQDIGRAVNSTATQETRDKAFTAATEKLALERGSLENELLKSQIVRLRQQSTPAFPAASAPAGVALLGGDVPKGAPNDPIKAVPGPEHVGVDPGATWLHHPGFSDASKTEDRYGDIGEEVKGGLINFPADLYWNMMNSPTFYGPLTRAAARWSSARRRASGDYYVSKRYRD